MNPTEQKAHSRRTDELQKSIDDTSEVLIALDERLSTISRSAHSRMINLQENIDEQRVHFDQRFDRQAAQIQALLERPNPQTFMERLRCLFTGHS